MLRGTIIALAKCTRIVSRQMGTRSVAELLLSRLGFRPKRGAARRLIRKFLAGVATILKPGSGPALVPALVPVRVRPRRR